MSVEKYIPGKITHEQKPYTQILRNVIQSCKNSFALHIWVYLQSMPEDWELNPAQLRKHFESSKTPVYNALNYLIASGLLDRKEIRNDKGKIVLYNYTVKNGTNFIQLPKKWKPEKKAKPVDNYPVPKKREVEKHPVPKKQDPVKRDTKEEIAFKKKYRSRESKPLPDIFEFDEKQVDACQAKGLDPFEVFLKFRSWVKSKGVQSADWTEEANLWIIREKVSCKEKRTNFIQKNESGCTVPWFNDNH